MMRRVVALMGTARPRPIPATAVLTPTRRPRPSTSAPPELPGLRAASVWMTSSTMRLADPVRAGNERPRALTDARGDGAGQAHGVAEGDDELADAQAGGVADLHGVKVAPLGPHDGEVGQRILAHDLNVELAAVGE